MAASRRYRIVLFTACGLFDSGRVYNVALAESVRSVHAMFVTDIVLDLQGQCKATTRSCWSSETWYMLPTVFQTAIRCHDTLSGTRLAFVDVVSMFEFGLRGGLVVIAVA